MYSIGLREIAFFVTLQPLGAKQFTIYIVKEDSNAIHMRHDTLISTMWLQKYRAQKNYYLSWVA